MRDRFESVEVPLVVAIGGAVGALLRWRAAVAIPSTHFPWATFVTNLAGCFLLGIVLVVGEAVGRPHHRHHRRRWARLWRPFLATGVLGGFTTFSTFAVEADALGVAQGLLYVGASVVLGLVAYALGNTFARAVIGVRA